MEIAHKDMENENLGASLKEDVLIVNLCLILTIRKKCIRSYSDPHFPRIFPHSGITPNTGPFYAVSTFDLYTFSLCKCKEVI